LALQIRSAARNKFPRHHDCSVPKHLKEGKTYEEAAIRGSKDELGKIDVRLERLVKFKMN
jgi:isopentenyldiphosphate isomerase